MLTWTGWTFIIQLVEVDESPYPAEIAGDYVLRMAETKAQAAAAKAVQPDSIVLAADTTVVDGTKLLGKPAGPQQAAEMLQELRGRVHQVYSAIAIVLPQDGRLMTDLCVSPVPMRAYTDSEIQEYIESGDPFDKAGAYAIQNSSFRPVINFLHCYASVMGLPLCHLVRTLRKAGIQPVLDVPAACQENLQYACPVFDPILKGIDPG
jgi:septum formation protein